MIFRCLNVFVALLLSSALAVVPAVRGADPALPDPILRIDTGGHSSFVTSLAWHPNGRELWSASWDKTVRLWRLNDNEVFEAVPAEAVRLPIGPGPNGKIDAIAVSSDGRYLAIGGYSGLMKRAQSFRTQGSKLPISSVELLEQGIIYVMDRENRSLKRLEGHRGPVSQLSFARSSDGAEKLVSVGFDQDTSNKKIASLRAWDVLKGRQVAGVLLPEPPGNLPSVAGFPSASSPSGLQVFAAWGNEKLYQWESDKPPQLRTYGDGQYNSLLPLDGNSFVTASADPATQAGIIKVWNLDAAGLAIPDARRQIRIGKQGNEVFLPLSCALLTQEVNAQPGMIAVALCVLKIPASGGNPVPDRFQLRIMSLADARNAAREVVRHELWAIEAAGIRVPDMAASADRNYLAIAGNPNHEIQVYTIPELLRGPSEPQHLAGLTSTPADVEFVENQGAIGLRMHDAMTAKRDVTSNYVFDLSNSRMVRQTEQASWKSSRPKLEGWSASQSLQDAREIRITQRGVLRNSVEIPADHKLSGFALTAAQPQTGMPLLAVAAHQDGQPWLGLFDVRDGTLKRLLQAHTEPIESLAVSADSLLLVTSCADQTLSIWDISDVDAILQPRSTLAGVALLNSDQGIVVDQVQKQATPAPFSAGDRLLGIVEGENSGKLRAVSTTEELNAILLEIEAGTKLVLRRQRGTLTSDETVSVQQAVDQRTPLFQLMVTKQTKADGRQWIGWSPLGPFDSSDQAIRSHLGWHFNMRTAGAPVAFAPLDQYPKLYEPGLIGNAIRNLGKDTVSEPLSLAEPRLKLHVVEPEIERWSAGEIARVRQIPSTVNLQITNRDFPADLVDTIELRVDGKTVGLMSTTTMDQWQLDGLSLPQWERGVHLLQAELKTNSIPPRSFVVGQQVEFFPLAPSISLQRELPSSTKQKQISLSADVVAGLPNESFEVNLVRVNADNPRDVLQSWNSEDARATGNHLEAKVDLLDGLNEFAFEASNTKANQDSRAAESARVAFRIQRIPPDENPPILTVQLFETTSGGESLPLVFTAHATIVSPAAEIRMSGGFAANEPLTEARFQGEALPGFAPNTVTETSFQLTYQLKPGSNKLRFESKTEFSRESVSEFNIDFRQPLAEIEIVSPLRNQLITELMAEPTTELLAVYQPNPGMRPLTASAIVNGQPLDIQLVIDVGQGTVRGRMPLQLGENSLQLVVANDTGVETQLQPVTIYYQPQPVVKTRQVPAEIVASTFDVELSGETATPIERVVLDGRELDASRWKSKFEGKQFSLQLIALAWQSDRTESEVAVYAKGAHSPAIDIIRMPQRLRPKLPPPSLVFISPSENASLSAKEVVLEYLVRSESQLASVELLQDGQRIQQPAVLDFDAQKNTSFRQQATFSLRPGLNVIQLLAENQDGMRSKSLTLNYVPSPVELELTSLTSAADAGSSARFISSDGGNWELSGPVKSGRNQLSGRVRWNYPDEKSLRNARLQVWISVNGFKQPVRLDLPEDGSLERKFSCPLHLFRTKGNLVEVTAPDLPALAGTQASAKVDCIEPELNHQRLHLVIIGVGVERAEETELMEAAVSTLSGSELRDLRNRKEFVFKSPAFAECVGYGPYTGPVVSREKIGSLLEMIRLKIQHAQATKPANDVLLVYYRGGEQVYDGGQFYLTTQQTQSDDEARTLRNSLQLQYFAVSSESLSEFVSHCPGSQLLLLDVARTAMGSSTASRAPDFVQGAATFRFAWLNNTEVPSDARLISGLQTSFQASRLAEAEKRLTVQHASLVRRYQDAVSYENYLPVALRELQIGSGPRQEFRSSPSP
jgi:WD40 repeat protein/5-hydroxyisourate hydrolase-like protein (transthyretin family)